MTEFLAVLAHNSAVHGGAIAFISAFGVDLHAWKSWQEAAFNWKTASFRWVSAAVFGALAGWGIGA